jgi:hypothetical protein
MADLKVGMVIRKGSNGEVRTVTAVGRSKYLYIKSDATDGYEQIGYSPYLKDCTEVKPFFELGKTYQFNGYNGTIWTVLAIHESGLEKAAFVVSPKGSHATLYSASLETMIEVDE